MENILDYLDNLLETHYKNNQTYPQKIVLPKDTYDKIFEELGKDSMNYDKCWAEKEDNYRGIHLKIDDNMEIIKLI